MPPGVHRLAASQSVARRDPRRDRGRACRAPRLRRGVRPRRGDLRPRHGAVGRPDSRARGGARIAHARRAPGGQRADPEVRRAGAPRRGLLVPRLHRRDPVVADRRRVPAAARPPAEDAAPRRLRAARPRLARLPGAPALSPAAAERGERLGGHHAALRIRALHERVVAAGQAALPPAACGGDAPQREPAVSSLLRRPRRVPPRAAAHALRAARRAPPRSVPELRQFRLLRRGG